MPVLMLSAYDEKDKPCAMLAVWGGISSEKEITVTVASRRSNTRPDSDKQKEHFSQVLFFW